MGVRLKETEVMGLKIGDKVEVKRWEELDSGQWNSQFFERNKGKQGIIKYFEEPLEISPKKKAILKMTKGDSLSKSGCRISVAALKKVEHIPEELFQID